MDIKITIWLITFQIIAINGGSDFTISRQGFVISEAKEFLAVGGVGQGPFHQRRPDRLVRRTVRGMLPFKQPKGKLAYKNLKVFIGIPEALKNQKMETIADAQSKKLKCSYFTVGEYSKEIGWNQGE